MTARVLIVDDSPSNVRLLQRRLAAEYFDVVTADSGEAALEICRQGNIDVVLLDVMMSGTNGFEVCQRLKSDPRTRHLPVLMVTALDQPADMVRGLEAGADDFLTKPVDDVQLLARVRGLSRLKLLSDELRSRAEGGGDFVAEDLAALEQRGGDDASILLVEPNRRQAERLAAYLQPRHRVEIVADPADAVMRAGVGGHDLAIVSMALGEFDPLRVCSQIRTLESSRRLPILLVAEEIDRTGVMRALDIGANDVIMRPVERAELFARMRTQVRRHRYSTHLRESLDSSLSLAITDDLTGLYNRRYFDRHLSMMLEKAREQERKLALMLVDIDYFDTFNEMHRHAGGDAVLKEFVSRLRRTIRGVDLPCRFTGEEFVVLMPDIDLVQAEVVAERVRLAIAERSFVAPGQQPLSVTCSVGIAMKESIHDTPETLIRRADIALYRAKREGRDRVISDAA